MSRLNFFTRNHVAVAALLVCGALLLALLSLDAAVLAGAAGLAICALLLFPESAVYALAFAVPYGSLLPLSLGGANLTAADFLLLVAWGVYLARSVAQRSLKLRVPPLVLPFVIFILAAAVSLTMAQSLTDSASELTKWIEMLAAYWLVAQFFDATRARRLLLVMFLAGASQALWGAYQFYFRAGPEGFLLFGGANLRAYGTFEQPNPYAGYLGLIIPLAFGTLLGMLMWLFAARGKMVSFARRLVFQEWLLLFAAGASFAVMMAALFFSYSRGAWIGVAAALGVTALLALVRSKRAAIAAMSLLLVVLVVVGLGEFNPVPDVISCCIRCCSCSTPKRARCCRWTTRIIAPTA